MLCLLRLLFASKHVGMHEFGSRWNYVVYVTRKKPRIQIMPTKSVAQKNSIFLMQQVVGTRPQTDTCTTSEFLLAANEINASFHWWNWNAWQHVLRNMHRSEPPNSQSKGPKPTRTSRHSKRHVHVFFFARIVQIDIKLCLFCSMMERKKLMCNNMNDEIK